MEDGYKDIGFLIEFFEEKSDSSKDFILNMKNVKIDRMHLMVAYKTPYKDSIEVVISNITLNRRMTEQEKNDMQHHFRKLPQKDKDVLENIVYTFSKPRFFPSNIRSLSLQRRKLWCKKRLIELFGRENVSFEVKDDLNKLLSDIYLGIQVLPNVDLSFRNFDQIETGINDPSTYEPKIMKVIRYLYDLEHKKIK